ncbi:hypothetical protein BC939DRAFT_152841 [Gamsiella multidivaricata]|uniref:uncharacterized protein n=1 Tax=Gamsiella multidivaricata TaxID=101098 RepID=UPI00221E9B13|nr:uncharacterized protein BC939DRAFT_152841 [Gamsiella multidivaricata]KAI7824074.1 hypothetical protein BC939DRAFT_152841 [Gamsiella multidivaricata]
MITERSAGKSVPTVLIVGGGLGGLMLATLLERCNVPYHVFERALELRALGSAMTLGATILPVFEQLGLYEEIQKMSLTFSQVDMYTTAKTAKKLGSIDMGSWMTDIGYDSLIFPRPKLYELLLKQVPPEKISLGKKVLRTETKEGKIHIYCADNTTYEGDLLVGSDGAYSGVRQSLFKQMMEEGVLPKIDQENLSIGYVSMVGVATAMDPEKYPQLKDNFCHFSQVLGEDTRSWGICSMANNQVGWLLSYQVSEMEGKEQHFRNSEWGPQSNEAMIKEFEDLPSPWGGTMGEFIRQTPKDLISKVYLEEKLFETWYHSQTVLIGDACHKMLPGAGQGAVSAMQDAVVLANCIYNMEDVRSESITAAFEEFYKQRYDRVNIQLKGSNSWSKILAGQVF